MTQLALEGPLAALREDEIKLLQTLADTLAEFGEETADDRRRLRDIAQDLSNMFFLVAVIGEFNAGKSSFINAFVGDELLPMGITPTTEAIELIRYAELPQRTPNVRDNGTVREWAHPNTGAPGVAIVDTPGTGSVFARHEAVAKDFLHRSDLVIFLVSAKRAFADTERLYMELARDYGKKIILVINQVDLLSDAELGEVRGFIERQVKETLGLDPLIFPVSAKQALESIKKPGAQPAGGIEAVRAHLRGVFAEAPPAKQKLLSQLDLAERIITRYQGETQKNAELVSADTTKVMEVHSELEQQSLGLDAQLKEATAEVDKVFSGLRRRGHTFIEENLSLRNIISRPSRAQLQADFQDVVIGRALRDINDATGDYINAVIDSSRAYWRSVIDRLNQLRELMEQELGGLDAGAYAEQRETLQDAIRIAKAELESYSSGRVVSEMQGAFETNLNGFTYSTFAAIGGVVAAVTAMAAEGALFAGTAAWASALFVVAAPITLLGGAAAYRYYRRVTSDTHKDFDLRVDQLEKTYREALDDLTTKERNRLKTYGNQVLTPIYSRLDVLKKRYADQADTLKAQVDEVQRLRENIKTAG